MKKRVLVSWVGHADVRSMAVDQPKSQQQKILSTKSNARHGDA
ncbi:MAG TPA: hypothetical protein VMW72_04565 [Sedimentisphaerales bacterium]|nr:hypothetical protein [Sedimentisphaerales bacterium]